MSSVADKVAVVTGAGSGIGRALALELAKRGARLAVSDIDDGGLSGTVDLLKDAGAHVHSAPLDVGDRDAVARYAGEVAEHFGVVHQVYNNAGIADSGAILKISYERYERMMRINLWGVIYGTKEFLPHLIDSGDGHIVNISSLNGLIAQPEMTAYCTAKFGVRGFTEALRVELAADGHPVRVSVVHPGGVATNIANAALAEAQAAGLANDQAERRAKTYNEKLLKMPPAQAARIIVGRDATALDLLTRFLPSRAPEVTVWLQRRIAGSR